MEDHICEVRDVYILRRWETEEVLYEKSVSVFLQASRERAEGSGNGLHFLAFGNGENANSDQRGGWINGFGPL